MGTPDQTGVVGPGWSNLRLFRDYYDISYSIMKFIIFNIELCVGINSIFFMN